MNSISLRIAYPIIITGLFIIVVIIAATYQILDTNFYIVLIPLTAFLFLFGFAIGQKFAGPVKELLKDADYLSQGHHKIRFYPQNKDELGQLAKVLNKIAEEFEDGKSKIETLDTQVKLRTKTLEEIIGVLEQKIKNRTFECQRAIDELEKNKLQMQLKDQEIVNLKNQITELSVKGTKSKKKK